MDPLVYVTSVMVTTLTMPREVVCVVVAMQEMVKTIAIVMAAFIDGSVAISNLNIILGCISSRVTACG